MTTDGSADDRHGENFLSRWSRRKIEARESVAIPATADPVARVPAAAPERPESGESAAAPVELPPVDSLRGLEGDYAGFLKPDVDDALRRTALKKLFADPHFNVIDVNEAYSGDWASASPIPAAALAMMEQAKHLLVDPDEKTKQTTDAPEREVGAQSAAADPIDTRAIPADPADATHAGSAGTPLPDGSAADAGPAPRDNA